MGRYGSGMGLLALASPTPVLRRGCIPYMVLDPSPSNYRPPIWDRDGTSPIPDNVLGSVYRPSDLVGDRASHTGGR
jgi:hypothetical protein